MSSKKIILTTLPKEGAAVQWVTPRYFQPDDSKYIPLGLLSLATNLPKRHEILVLDPFSNNWGLEETIEKIEREHPHVLGISSMTFSSYQMGEILQKTSASYKVVGGPHATHNAKTILNQGADAVFVGQLADLEFSQAVDSEPRGIIYCDTKINQIRFPDRKFVDIGSYFPKGNLFKSNKRMPMFSGVGCPHRCRFCDVQTKHTERKTSSSVLEEMIYLRDIGAGSIHVYEDNFNTDGDYLKQVCDEMDKRDFRFEWSGRGEAKMSLDTARMLKDRGFKRIHVGIESLSDRTLGWFRKVVNYSQIQRFCETMNETGIDMVGFFIVGAPTETEEDRKTMFAKIKNLNIKYPLINILQPLPNTEYYTDLLKEGIYSRDYWADYIKNPVPNFMIPFPYGKAKWEEDAAFVEQITHKIEAWKKERGEN